jgi:hypothetical protein
VDVIPTWTAPHHFTPIAAAAAATTNPVFTYLLASCELVAALDAADPIERLAQRIGLEWAASNPNEMRAPETYADLRKGHPANAPDLRTFLAIEAGIGAPGQPSFTAATGKKRAKQIPPSVLANFVANDLPRLWDFAFDIAPLVAELEAAADRREPPDPARVDHPEGGFQAAGRLLETYAPTLAYTALRTPRGDLVWGLAFDNLASRIAVELFELFATRPQLRRCRYCNRAFAPLPGGSKTACHTHLWRQRGKTFETVETCSPPPTDAHIAAAHTRERKRRHQAMQREIERHGADSRRAEIARRDFEEWTSANQRRRGPKQRPMPPLVIRDP